MLLRMKDGAVVVRVFGVPTAGTCRAREGWREATEWMAHSLKSQFGDQVRVEYVDLFSEKVDQCPAALALVTSGEAIPPLIFVDDELLTSGGKISGPAVHRRLESLGIKRKREEGHTEKDRDV